MSKQRAFLKWPGGKYRVLDHIRSVLPEGNKLIEPFVGSGVVFMNTEYKSYLLNDINPDVIDLYQRLKQEGEHFINYARSFFVSRNNNEKKYYQLRARFNRLDRSLKRAALFLYLNRHGYNGLCRYNQSGIYNVPFGRYRKPYFPETEMFYFHEKAQRATFVCEDFEQTLMRARRKNVVYCDPPYIPLSQTACFTTYQKNGFGMQEQIRLSEMAKALSDRTIPVLISNHNTAFARQLYRKAKKNFFPVQRFISCATEKRDSVQELLALFD